MEPPYREMGLRCRFPAHPDDNTLNNNVHDDGLDDTERKRARR